MMRYTYIIWLLFITLVSCFSERQAIAEYKILQKKSYTRVAIKNLDVDSSSIRAIDVRGNLIAYAGSNGRYGVLSFDNAQMQNDSTALRLTNKHSDVITYLEKHPSFRSLAITENYIFLMSIASPALLYKYDILTQTTELVYVDSNEKIFFDSMAFWNSQEGIAIGDPVDGCLSILTTRDGGMSWNRIVCDRLPKTKEGEAAFAASDTNIKIIGDEIWVVSGGGASRIFYSPDKGMSWSVYDTPLLQGKSTQGAYTIDFYDRKIGIAYGGDYTSPLSNISNIATTSDGGKTWQLTASGSNDGYKSCVQYIPNSHGSGLVAMGFTGISYSDNNGKSWKTLSEKGYLSFRFINDSTAIASGTNKLSIITFR